MRLEENKKQPEKSQNHRIFSTLASHLKVVVPAKSNSISSIIYIISLGLKGDIQNHFVSIK